MPDQGDRTSLGTLFQLAFLAALRGDRRATASSFRCLPALRVPRVPISALAFLALRAQAVGLHAAEVGSGTVQRGSRLRASCSRPRTQGQRLLWIGVSLSRGYSGRKLTYRGVADGSAHAHLRQFSRFGAARERDVVRCRFNMGPKAGETHPSSWSFRSRLPKRWPTPPARSIVAMFGHVVYDLIAGLHSYGRLVRAKAPSTKRPAPTSAAT
jgi:hypothetical protein